MSKPEWEIIELPSPPTCQYGVSAPWTVDRVDDCGEQAFWKIIWRYKLESLREGNNIYRIEEMLLCNNHMDLVERQEMEADKQESGDA